MKQTKSFQSKNKTPSNGGPGSKFKSLMSVLLCAACQRSTWAVLLLLGSKTL